LGKKNTHQGSELQGWVWKSTRQKRSGWWTPWFHLTPG